MTQPLMGKEGDDDEGNSLGIDSILLFMTVSYRRVPARRASYPIPIRTTATRLKSRPAVVRMCHWLKTMQRLVVSQVKSIC
ncbi:hypothetical protein VMCG_06165 [Cytospora schulzeri]|uniref:Uncharacterized protein n=1 Tax=Cytospora schulzeri TaxID=448051 RepID=A0A423W9E1_9PEZI|nr:hypothetical protein VMCG_06165 [Valsa malicola]